MARGLFVNGPAEGHINPTLGVVEELTRRGEEIVYFTADPFRHRIESCGAVVRLYDGEEFRKRMEPFFAPGRRSLLEKATCLLRSADVVISSVVTQTKGEHFDYLIHDANLGGGWLLARIMHLPSISSCTTFASAQPLFEQGLKEMSRFASEDENRKLQEEFRDVAAEMEGKYGVRIESAYEAFCNPADMTLVYTTRQFQPYGEAFDQTYKFVGPSISSRQNVHRVDWTAISGVPVVYISLGTIMNRAVSFYKLCFEALKSLNLNVILSVGNEDAKREFADVPANFTVCSYVDQLDVLNHADLFITHGGMNSVSEGLLCGVPLIVIPQNADQFMVAQRVADMMAGVQIPMHALTEEQLRETVLILLRDNSYKQSAKTLGKWFREAGGFSRAADEINNFKLQCRISD
jgi:MGT family glycosyltransferase